MTDFARLLGTLARHEVAFIVISWKRRLHMARHDLLRTWILFTSARRPIWTGWFERCRNTGRTRGEFLRDCHSFGTAERWNAGSNFTLTTLLGDIDVLGEIPGGGGYGDLAAAAIELQVFETRCLFLSLAQLIRAKRAAGRPKDLEALAELEAIAEEGE